MVHVMSGVETTLLRCCLLNSSKATRVASYEATKYCAICVMAKQTVIHDEVSTLSWKLDGWPATPKLGCLVSGAMKNLMEFMP